MPSFGQTIAAIAIGCLVSYAVWAFHPTADPNISLLGGAGAALAAFLTFWAMARDRRAAEAKGNAGVPPPGERKFDKLFKKKR